VVVHFAAPSDGASANLSDTQPSTDASGYAAVTATANTIAGSYNVVANVDGVSKPATFALTNTAGVASQLAIASGDAQSATVLTTFANPLVVHASDAFGNAAAGATIAFLTPAGGPGAVLSATSATTDADGNASVTATANAIAGGFFVAATLDAQQATFSLTNLAGAASNVVATSGTPQTATVGTAFANPLVVHVTDAEGNAITGATVSFTAPTTGAGASLSATSGVTDANGNVSVTAAANAAAGAYQVTASVNGVAAAAVFELTNTLDPSDVIFANGFDPN